MPAADALHNIGNTDPGYVSGFMAVAVIDDLKIIHIAHNQDTAHILSIMALHFTHEVILHITPVVKAGEPISESHIVELFHIIFKLPVHPVQLILLLFHAQVRDQARFQFFMSKRLLNIIAGAEGKAPHHILIAVL